MNTLWKLLCTMFPCIVAPFFRTIKLELLYTYEKVVDTFRAIFSLYVLVIFFMMLTLAGFLMVHISLFILLPWSVQTKGFILLGLGLLYFLTAFLWVLKWCSKKTWMQHSGAKSMRESINRD